MITYSNNSLFNNLSKQSVILQQVGTKGWIGVGLTKRIFLKYPQAYKDYYRLCQWFKDGHEKELLGYWARTRCNKNLIVCNAITQYTIGNIKQQVDYNAWEEICNKLEKQTHYINQKLNTNWKIHTFEKIGVDAGTNLTELNEIFKKYFQNSPTELIIHSY